ncbi:uncharacterized protein LOC111691627 [Anoplophora glabripennis]|uniref:uncharacterized protein LOC111691627 n=1 Tax=Anoplophora glabripennis TaxID=217634 RepID=UPI000C77C9FC|nr:uncharacterized protein LOC111691627 [Anoplophora glabripennis]
MDSRMFLLEFHIGTIHFDSNFKPVPQKEEILINVKFADVSINIDPEELPPVKTNDKDRQVLYNMGKSYLFTTSPKELINSLKEQLEMSLRVNQKTVGCAALTWSNDFTEMVKLFEKIGVVKAVDYSDVEELKGKSGQVVGKMDIFLRLSCLGNSVETQYQANVVGQRKEYIFKNPYDRHTFKCELISGTEVLPVMNLLNPVTRVENTSREVAHCASWTEIFGMGEAPSKASYSPFVGSELQQGGLIPLTEILQRNSVETISIVFRPEENKFYDLLNVFNTEVSTTRDTTKLTFTKEKEKPAVGASGVQQPEETAKVDDPLELTADKINKKLCKNKDCPAAKKFKEYGIGPLATGKGLGTLYGDIESPIEYGLSHTYGTMSKYGPFGIYSRPKRPDQPFIPSKNAQETTLPPEPNKKCCKCCGRLRGGGPWPDQSFKFGRGEIHNRSCSNSKQRWSDILRLKGGGPLDVNNSGQLKSPIKECKAVMDKFDEILAAYKRALGPCGQATCPNAPSMAQEKCKSVCGKGETIPRGKGESIPRNKNGGVLCETPCDNKEGYTAAACRDPKCAYAKYKLDLVDDDAAIELQFLPPAVSGKCGHPKCPYPLQPNLPPIHWDCPEPLPKGICKNPNCPLQPPDLKKLKCPAPKPGPCGSSDCPYALPPPCDLPTCPFRPKPTCPFLEKEQKVSCYQPEQQEEEEYVCENPECPFANEKINPSESFDMKGQFIDCANPQCPFATKGKPCRPKAKSDKMNICGNPSCPFANVRKMKLCGNPSCPYAPKPKKQSYSCGDPQCPFAEMTNGTSKPKKSDVCDDPNCPFAGMNHPLSKPPKNKSNETENCDNPDCPFNEEKCSKTSADCNESQSVCENPECPFAEKEQPPVCDDPLCPYMQPLPSCGIPGCPYEPIPVIPCPGPKKQSIVKQPASSQDPETIVMVETEIVQVSVEKGENNEVCGDNGGGKVEQIEMEKNGKKKKKKRSKFVYTMGNQYPGVKVGHKECVTPMFKVPPKMGWLWNIPMEVMNLKPRRGWKPGAIQKSIAAKIRAHREAKGLGILRLPKFKKNKGGIGYDDDGDDVVVTPKPTLQIQKKDGAYWITMNPLKDPKTLVDNENPYMECTPMQFKITKNKKKKDDDDSRLCYCDEGDDESSSSSDSELDIEFTPPAGIIHPERFKKKKNIVHCEAQYDTKDFEPEKPEAKGKKGKGGKGDKKKGDKGSGKGGDEGSGKGGDKGGGKGGGKKGKK